MATYSLYKLIFKTSSEQELFDENSKKKDVSKALSYLYKTLQKKELLFVHCKRSGDCERIEHEVCATHDKVVLLMLKNNKSTRYVEGREGHDLKYHPGCYVIFDCREGVAQLAIERIAAFDNKPDKVCKILDYTLNATLRKVGLEVEIRPKMREGDFWAAVDEQTKRFKDDIRRMSFEFPKKESVNCIDAPRKLREKLHVLQSILSSVKAAKGVFHMESEKKEALDLDTMRQDVAQLVHLCLSNGYRVSVQFKHYGVFRVGENVRAMSELNEEIVDQFIYGEATLLESKWRLIDWLNEARNRTSNYKLDDHETTDNAAEAEN